MIDMHRLTGDALRGLAVFAHKVRTLMNALNKHRPGRIIHWLGSAQPL